MLLDPLGPRNVLVKLKAADAAGLLARDLPPVLVELLVAGGLAERIGETVRLTYSGRRTPDLPAFLTPAAPGLPRLFA